MPYGTYYTLRDVSEMDPGSTVRESEMTFHQSDISSERTRVREPTGAKAAKNDGSERRLEERAPTGEARLRVPGGASARERNATAIAPSRVERHQWRSATARCDSGAPVSDGALSCGALTGRGARSALHRACCAVAPHATAPHRSGRMHLYHTDVTKSRQHKPAHAPPGHSH